VDRLPRNALRPFPLLAAEHEQAVTVNKKSDNGFPVLGTWETPGASALCLELAVGLRKELVAASKGEGVEAFVRRMEQERPFMAAVRGKAKADYYNAEKIKAGKLRFYNAFPSRDAQHAGGDAGAGGHGAHRPGAGPLRHRGEPAPRRSGAPGGRAGGHAARGRTAVGARPRRLVGDRQGGGGAGRLRARLQQLRPDAAPRRDARGARGRAPAARVHRHGRRGAVARVCAQPPRGGLWIAGVRVAPRWPLGGAAAEQGQRHVDGRAD